MSRHNHEEDLNKGKQSTGQVETGMRLKEGQTEALNRQRQVKEWKGYGDKIIKRAGKGRSLEQAMQKEGDRNSGSQKH